MIKGVSIIIKRSIIIILLLNFIYLSGCLIYYQEDFSLKDTIYKINNPKYLFVSDAEETSIDFQTEIDGLFAKVEENENNQFWLKDTKLTNTEIIINPALFTSDPTNSKAWINKNELYYDIRFTLAVYLNYIKNEMYGTLKEISVPFHWVDWIDLNYLNEFELKKPLKDRRRCGWMERLVDRYRFKFSELNCINNDDVSPNTIKDFGFENHNQLPGFIMKGFSLRRATIDVRLAQAKSFIMTNLPNPYKLIFLNKDNGTYEVNVDQNSKKRIIKSNLIKSYLENNDLLEGNEPPKTLKLDPVVEFKALKQRIKPKILSPEDDIYNVYSTVHSKDTTQTKNLPIPKDAFLYTREYLDSQLTKFDSLEKGKKLNHIGKSYLESLRLSKERNTFDEFVYFRQATLLPERDSDNIDQDKGYHYDWRFFTGTLNGKRKNWNQDELTLRQEVILDRLSRSWFRFAEEKGFLCWMMHGPLLSWYWNGLMFPFDDDLDIQMPAKDLARLGELYNQSLVIEDIEEGFGKFLIDIGTFVHNRDVSRRENHIDARFIDIDTGLYIDITGLSISEEKIPEEFENDKEFLLINEETRNDEVFNDRRKHWYKLNQLSPLKYTALGGVPLYLPNEVSKRLIFEYPNGITKPEYDNWFFIPKINLWVNRDKLIKIFDTNDFIKMSSNRKEHGKIDDEKLSSLVLDMDEEQVIKLLKSDNDILCEYYKTKNITDIHSQEKQFLFEIESVSSDDGTVNLKISDRELTGETFDAYNKFVHSNIKMSEPLRKSIFQFEVIEQPLHHHD